MLKDSIRIYLYITNFRYFCILHSLTVGFAEQNGRDAERAVARLD